VKERDQGVRGIHLPVNYRCWRLRRRPGSSWAYLRKWMAWSCAFFLSFLLFV